MLVLAGTLHGDELNERLRKEREREEGMNRQIEDVNKKPEAPPAPDPSVGTFLENFQARQNAAEARRQQQERAVRLAREAEQAERDAIVERNRQRRLLEEKFAELDRRAAAGDVNAMAGIALPFLLGTYRDYDLPQDLARAEKYYGMIVALEDKPDHVGYYGDDIVMYGGLQFLRGDRAGAVKTWQRLSSSTRTAEASSVAALCVLAARLMETGAAAPSPDERRLIAGVLAAQAGVVTDPKTPKMFFVAARVILDAFRRAHDVAPAATVIDHLADYYRFAKAEEAVVFRPNPSSVPAPGANPPPVFPVTTRRELWLLVEVMAAAAPETIDEILTGGQWDIDEYRVDVLHAPVAALLDAAAARLKVDDHRRRIWQAHWLALVQLAPAYTFQNKREMFARVEMRRFVNLLRDGIYDPKMETGFCDEAIEKALKNPAAVTPDVANDLLVFGQKIIADKLSSDFAPAMVAIGHLRGGTPPPDGAAALAWAKEAKTFLHDDKLAATLALDAAARGPEDQRVEALSYLIEFDRPKAVEIATSLAEKGVAEAIKLLARLSFPCDETVPAMQNAHRWLFAARGESVNAAAIGEVEEWLERHDAVAASESPALRAAVAALAAAATPDQRQAAVDRLEAVVAEEYRVGSLFAYNELRRFAGSPADADGRAALFLEKLLANAQATTVPRTTAQVVALGRDQAALFLRAAGRGQPEVTALFAQPTIDPLTERLELNEAFAGVDERNWDTLLALASTAEAKSRPEMLAAIQRSLREPATLERLVHALRVGTRKTCAALETPEISYPFQTQCLNALLALVPVAEKNPVAWAELYAAVRDYPEAPFRWTEIYGPFHGALYATCLEWHRLRAGGQPGDALLDAYCRGRKPDDLVADAFRIGSAPSGEPIEPEIVSVYDTELGRALLERGIAAGAPDADQLRRRFTSPEPATAETTETAAPAEAPAAPGK